MNNVNDLCYNMNMKKYIFNPEDCYNQIKNQFLDWFKNVNCTNVVLGISGGKDSTVCAYLLAKMLGPEHVYGIMLPNGLQKDINDSMEVIKLTGINSKAFDIGNAVNALTDQLKYNGLTPSVDTTINMPPRVRMTALYAIAQTVNGIVINTDNLDEIVSGYYTIFGDGAGSYGLLRNLTVGEVIELGKWLGVPEHLIMKTPGDGLQEKGDEDRLGFKYADLDNYIRKNAGPDEFKGMILKRYFANKFKTDIVNIPAPKFDYPNAIAEIQNSLDFAKNISNLADKYEVK